jgi:hypothetical protein
VPKLLKIIIKQLIKHVINKFIKEQGVIPEKIRNKKINEIIIRNMTVIIKT